jgi:pimeloyl-ACP methyl ester carboxylesterase
VRYPRTVSTALSGATLEVVENAGHAVVVEAAARVAAFLEAFLARVGREGGPS